MNKLTWENGPFVDTIGTYASAAWAIHSAVDENIITQGLDSTFIKKKKKKAWTPDIGIARVATIRETKRVSFIAMVILLLVN